MRIIIEPTQTQENLRSDATHHRVIIEHPHDGIGMDHVIQLLKSALVAYGYGERAVNQYFNDYFNDEP